MIRIKSPQDFGAGMLFIAVGAFGLYFGRDYAYGSAAQMGPGYFPMWLSGMIVCFGIVVGVQSLRVDGPAIERIRWRPSLLIWVALLSFGYLINYLGLALTGFLVAVMAGLASRESRMRELIPLAAFLGIAATLLFVVTLGQPMPPWLGDIQSLPQDILNFLFG